MTIGNALPYVRIPPRIFLGKFARACSVFYRRSQIGRYIRKYRPTLAAISESTRQTFLRAGFPEELLITRPWGIDETPLRTCIATDGGSRTSPLRIGYLGSMRPHKGCHVLLEAYKKLGRPAELHFFGSGDAEYIASIQKSAPGTRP